MDNREKPLFPSGPNQPAQSALAQPLRLVGHSQMGNMGGGGILGLRRWWWPDPASGGPGGWGSGLGRTREEWRIDFEPQERMALTGNCDPR
jgi:hypothetical protein